MGKKNLLVLFLLALPFSPLLAQQWEDEVVRSPLQPGKGLTYRLEMQAGASDGHNPLWLNANRHGLSSIESLNGYLRAAVERPISEDSARRWGLGYGVDVALPYHYTSKAVVQQLFVDLQWLHGRISIGSKEYPMELKDNLLSSGSQALGINARPVPQIRVALPDYWKLPLGGGWLWLKGHIAYGKMTDDNWQHSFTHRQSKYADDVLFHSKAGYLKIGNPDRFIPFSIELGLEMATTFGGVSYLPSSEGMTAVHGGTSLSNFWKAFIPGGGEVVEAGTAYQNAMGNHLGAWVMRFNYDADLWGFSLYADKYFEDHSSMLQLDYDGYGSGEEWNVKKKRRFFLYDFKDIMLGAELRLKYNPWITKIVFEYLYSRYQSGPLYHDHTLNMSDHISGRDNFYQHYIYTGWQHWGQVIGNPLYRSPIYNTDGTIEVADSRFTAFHLGMRGNPLPWLGYRLLASYQEGLGTYLNPYLTPRHNVSVLAEATASLPRGWQLTAAAAADMGSILGHNYGGQLTIVKKGFFSKKRRNADKY